MTDPAPAPAVVDEDDLTDDELLDTEGPAVEVRGLTSAFGDNIVHQGLDLTAERGEVLGVVGGSGAGKSVLLNTIIGLRNPMMVLSSTDLPAPEPPTTPSTSPRSAVRSRP